MVGSLTPVHANPETFAMAQQREFAAVAGAVTTGRGRGRLVRVEWIGSGRTCFGSVWAVPGEAPVAGLMTMSCGRFFVVDE